MLIKPILNKIEKFKSFVYGKISWEKVEEIGVDEIPVSPGQKYLTLVYQLDKGLRCLLWSEADRKVKTLLRFFRQFGQARWL